MKKIVIDLDGTLTKANTSDYVNVLPNKEVIETLKAYKSNGFYIVVNTARNMRTYKGNIGKINVNTLPIITKWLDANNIPYDEIHVGKPWCGKDGFYVDDRSIRPSEFSALTFDEITELINRETSCF